jgi:hypothetical protein
MPTLTDLAGLPPLGLCPAVSRDVALCTEGSSLVPILQNPNSTTDFKEVWPQARATFFGGMGSPQAGARVTAVAHAFRLCLCSTRTACTTI